MNPANMPQLYLIKNFCVRMKCEPCKNEKIAADINQFHQIWSASSQNLTNTVTLKFMQGVRTKQKIL